MGNFEGSNLMAREHQSVDLLSMMQMFYIAPAATVCMSRRYCVCLMRRTFKRLITRRCGCVLTMLISGFLIGTAVLGAERERERDVMTL